MATINTTINNYTQSSGIGWLTGNVNGQKWAKSVDQINSNLVFNYVQGVLARFPDYCPQDGYRWMSAERQIVQGYNDGYNVGGSSTDGYLFPARIKQAKDQWTYAGSALGVLLQLHYQGVDGYIIQQSGIAYNLDADVSYSVFPANKIKLVCLTGGFLGTAVFKWETAGNTGTINTQPGIFSFLIPNTQTILYFPQFNYLLNGEYFIDITGFFTYNQGATPSISQITGPQNKLNQYILDPDPNTLLIDGYAPNTGYPVYPITITITTGGALGTMAYSWSSVIYSGSGVSQSSPFSVLLTGTQTRAIFNSGSYVLGSTYTINTDGTITASSGAPTIISQYSTPSLIIDGDLWNSFLFMVSPIPSWWTNIQIPATITSTPSITIINTIRSVINTWKSSVSICSGIVVPISGNIWGWPPDTKWGSGLTWGSPTPLIYTYGVTDDTNYIFPPGEIV